MAADYFLRIDGIPGESTDAKHKGEIDVESFAWGETQPAPPASGSGGGAGKVAMQPLRFTARTSSASPMLLLACAMGQHIKSAVLSGRRGVKAGEFLTFSLSDVLVTSYETAAADDAPVDAVALSFGRIVVEYRAQKADGTLGAAVKAGWDAKANKKV